MKHSVILLIISVCALSCSGDDGSGFVPDPYVQEIVYDRAMPEHAVLASCTAPLRSGDITVAGSMDRCLSFVQTFLSLDTHDNVSGCHAGDGLPDFSGEKIVAISDMAGVSRTGSLPSPWIGSYICALDTTYHLSPYDPDGLGRKNRAKLIVFADPSCYVSCKDNIDCLSDSFGSSVPYVFPLEIALRRSLGCMKSDKVTVGFICDSTSCPFQDYRAVLAAVASSCGREVATSFIYRMPEGCTSPMLSFMDAYISGGNTLPLDAVIVDAYVADISVYEETAVRMGSVLSPESLVYGKYLSDDFSVCGVYESAADCCFHIMRDMNLFTHNIIFPYSETFGLAAHPDSSQHSYILVPNVI